MALQLNQDHEHVRIDGNEFPFFREYYGRNADQVSYLLDCNRIPMSTAHLMQRRLDIRNANADVKTAWMGNYFDTSDLKAQRESEVKLVLTTYSDGSVTPLGRKYLGLINPQEQLINGAVNLGINDRYENLKGDGVLTTTREKLAEVIDNPMTKQQAKDSLFWRFVLRHPDEVPKEFAISGLHEEAILYIFAEDNQGFQYFNTNMEVYSGSCSKNVPEMRAWSVRGLDNRSYANGLYDLDYDFGRLVGIAPEALSAPSMATPNVKPYSTADVQKARKELGALTQVRPELLKSISSLLGINLSNKIF